MPYETEYQVTRTPAPRLYVQEAASSSKVQRNRALDFTKGALVLIMVLYHWINYFIGPQWEYYEYLRFLTPSFIFITGFIISNVYLSKYASGDPRLSKRLFTRGVKLMAIFLFLNAARTFVAPVSSNGALVPDPLTARNIFTVFVSGNLPVSGGKLVAFPILVPISYVLTISAALMLPYKLCRYTFHILCVLLLFLIVVLGLIGARSYNLELVTIGMLGVLTGFTPLATIDRFARHPYTLAVGYLAYALAITIWNVPFPLLVIGVILSLMVIYLVGAKSSGSGRITRGAILLGKYSLFGYISQIAILQILSGTFRHMNPGVAILAISLFAAFALTILSVEVVDCARTRRASIDRLYKAVFA